MSFMYSGLQRSDRLLPLESCEVLSAIDRFRVHVLDDECDAKLHEHVSFYWDQQWGYQYYQRRLLREVGSTRGPVRFVGFPQVRQSRTVREDRDQKAATVVPHHAPHLTAPALSAATHNSAETSSEPTASSSSSPQQPSRCDAGVTNEESKWWPPRTLAAWNWVRLVAPYERLLCPSLQFSALLSPAVKSSTPLIYGTQPPSSASRSGPSVAECCMPARWSSQTCRTLWSLHEAAAAASLPVQEVYVLCAGTLLYLDVVVTAGKVWAELEGLWGSDFLNHIECSNPDGGGESSIVTSTNQDTSAETATVSSLKTTLSQPPQTYASLLQHVRVLLEAILCVTPAAATGTRVSARGTASTPTPTPPQPFLPWLAAAMEAVEWTASATPAASTMASASSSAVKRDGDARHTSALAQVLKAAVQEWLLRRGTTVTAALPTGSHAVSLPRRDICGSRGSQPSSRSAAASAAATRPRATTARGTRAQANATSTTSWSNAASSAAQTDGDAKASSPALHAPIAFDAFEPHDTPRALHPFLLPPLPQDPAHLVFAAVWRRTLRRCVEEKDVVRQRLRQVILGQAGQRCEELLREVRQQECAAAEQHTGVSSPSSVRDGGGVTVTAPAIETAIADSKGSSTTPSSSSAPVSVKKALSSPPSSDAASAATHLLLLTGDPTAMSFRVLGPRSGEWVTSRAGAWGGFRGELFRCVGHPPPPLASCTVSSAFAGWGPPGSATARLRHRPSPSSAPRKEGTSTPPVPLLERFEDGALDLDSSTRLASSHSASSSRMSIHSVSTPTPFSAEELADRLCRLGAALPRYATEITGDRLRPADADFAREVLQQQCLPLFLACKRRGIQQWSLRGWMKGIALTLLDNSGTESRVATPAKLLETSRQQLTASLGGVDVGDTAAALRMVMEGGLNEVVAYLEYAQKRKDRLLRWLPVKRVTTPSSVSSASSSSSAPSLLSSSAVEALLLRRSEEGAIFSIFQCHPQAIALAGCGVRRLALHANAHKSRSSLLLVRTCGVVVEWDVQDCYEPPRHRRLRVPTRLMSQGRRSSGGAGDVEEDAPPPEIGNAVERLTLRHVRGMLQYYRRALVASQDEKAAAATPASTNATPSLSAPSPGTKRDRDEDKGETASLSQAATQGVGDGDDSCGKTAVRTPVTPDKEDRSGTRTPLRSPSSQPVDAPEAPPESTSVFPIDRAVALFVLRHHPHYFNDVAGCGIREVYVAIRSASTEAAAAAGSLSEGEGHREDDAGRTSTFTQQERQLHHQHDEQPSGAPSPEQSTARPAGTASSSDSTKAVLVVERVCGQRVEVDIEACYDQRVDGCPLRPRLNLV